MRNYKNNYYMYVNNNSSIIKEEEIFYLISEKRLSSNKQMLQIPNPKNIKAIDNYLVVGLIQFNDKNIIQNNDNLAIIKQIIGDNRILSVPLDNLDDNNFFYIIQHMFLSTKEEAISICEKLTNINLIDTEVIFVETPLNEVPKNGFVNEKMICSNNNIQQKICILF